MTAPPRRSRAPQRPGVLAPVERGHQNARETLRTGDTYPSRHDQYEFVATAAAHLDSTPQVSPELALVDAALAEDLRASLDAPLAIPAVALHVVSVPTADLEWDETAVADVPEWVAESSSDVDTSDLIVGATDDDADQSETTAASPSPPEAMVGSVDDDARTAAPEYDDTSDLIVGTTDRAAHGSEATSRYPSLPAPEDAGVDPMDAAEAALREIRARMTTDAPETRRLFRTRFTVALGGSTFCAVAALAAHVYYGFAQLPV